MRPEETFINQPIRSLQTMLRVIAEDRPEYLSIIPDGIYGPDTVSAVSRFQINHGLPVTGITNQETWDTITRTYEESIIEQAEAEALWITLNPGQIYRKGESAPNLYLVQAILTVMSEFCSGVARPSFNGILDEATEDSISSFQQLNGIPMTGRLNKKTWKSLALHYPQAAKLYNKRK